MSNTVLITGATSGFGAAAVRRFAAAGWKVVATGRRAARQGAFLQDGCRSAPCAVHPWIAQADCFPTPGY